LAVPGPEELAPVPADADEAAPWMPELQASRNAPPPMTAAPTPAARNRLRRETPPAGAWLSLLSCRAVWSVIFWDLSLISLRTRYGREITSG
jgi:hypothetical protein